LLLFGVRGGRLGRGQSRDFVVVVLADGWRGAVWVGDVGLCLDWAGPSFDLVVVGGGDAGHVFDADEAVGHFDVWLVEEVDKEVVMWLRGDEGGCHSEVLIVVFLCVAGLINGCFYDID
jgi:hypothetical protein